MSDQSTPTPAQSSYGDEEVDKLVAAGQRAYALKKYEVAVESFGKACEVYSTNHGEDNPKLLFTYGKCLFNVAVSQSAVLGDAPTSLPEETEDDQEESSSDAGKEKGGQEAPASGQEPTQDQDTDTDAGNGKDDDAEDAGAEEAESEESDFEVAWEILDLARTLFVEQLEKQDASEEELRDIKLKLADTYDLLGEVSIESENFSQASEDLASSLKLKEQLYPAESTLISEAHYKLSLAYEFTFDQDDDSNKVSRDLAITHMVKAIDSVKLRIEKSGQDDPELVRDLEEKLAEMKSNNRESTEAEKSKVLEGIIGQVVGAAAGNEGAGGASSSKSQILRALSQATSNANDLNSLVKRKKSDSNGATKKARKE